MEIRDLMYVEASAAAETRRGQRRISTPDGIANVLIEVAAQHPLIDGVTPGAEFAERLRCSLDLFRRFTAEGTDVEIYVPGSRLMDEGVEDKISLSAAGCAFLRANSIPLSRFVRLLSRWRPLLMVGVAGLADGGRSLADRGKEDRDRWARLPFVIIGPVLASPPAKGQLRAALTALSERTWRHPVGGRPIRFGVSTLERWYHAARAAGDDPVTALRTRVRADAGQSRQPSPTVMAAIEAQYKQHPSWSVQLHYDNLGVAPELPSCATVCRYFAAHGLRKLRRGVEVAQHFAPREVRSFEAEHTNAL